MLRHKDVQFNNAARTIKVNKQQKEKRDLKHNTLYDISQAHIENMIQKMIFDIDSGESKYREAILLLPELCTGSRFGECVMASKYEYEGTRKTRRKDLKAEWLLQTGLLKKRSARRR